MWTNCILFYKIGTYTMGDNWVSKAVHGAPVKVINIVNDRQRVGIVLWYLLDCQKSEMWFKSVRCDLLQFRSLFSLLSEPSLCFWAPIAQSQTRLQLVKWHCHCEAATQKNMPDNTKPEIKPIILTWLGKLDSRMWLTFLPGNICDVWLHDTHITRRQFNGALLLQSPCQ